MSDRQVAYCAVVVPQKGFGIAIVEKDVAGYTLDPTEPLIQQWNEASNRAAAKNRSLGLEPRAAWDIVSTAMTKSAEMGGKWRPRGS